MDDQLLLYLNGYISGSKLHLTKLLEFLILIFPLLLLLWCKVVVYIFFVHIILKTSKTALNGVAQLVGHQAKKLKVTGSILVQGTCLGCSPVPGWGMVGLCMRSN